MQELSPYFIKREPYSAPQAGYVMSAAEQSSVRDYWAVVRRRLRLIEVSFLGAVGLTTLVIFNLTPVYTAQSTLLVESRTPQVLDTRDPATTAPLSTEHDYYKTQYNILRSRSLAATVIGKLDLVEDPYFRTGGKDA